MFNKINDIKKTSPRSVKTQDEEIVCEDTDRGEGRNNGCIWIYINVKYLIGI